MTQSNLRIPRHLPLGLTFAAMLAGASVVAVAQEATTKANDAATAQVSWSDLDTNQDGNLSASEAEASPGLKAQFAQADANADGALTGEEYRSFLAQKQDGMKSEPGKAPHG